MDGVGLMESLLNSIKPLHIAVVLHTIKLQICQKIKYQPIPDILRIHEKSQNSRYRNLISQIFESHQFCRYVGDITRIRTAKKAVLQQNLWLLVVSHKIWVQKCKL